MIRGLVANDLLNARSNSLSADVFAPTLTLTVPDVSLPSMVTCGASTLANGTSSLASGASELNSGASTLASGASTLASGASTLANGTSSLASGASDLKSGSSKVVDGIDELSDGAKELADGTKKFEEEGTSKLKSTFEDDLGDVLDRIQALNSDKCAYTSYSGKANGMDGSVKFIIETAAIEAAEE